VVLALLGWPVLGVEGLWLAVDATSTVVVMPTQLAHLPRTAPAAFAILLALITLAAAATPGRARHRGGPSSVPPAALGSVSAGIGKHDPRYRVLGLRAHNPAQHLQTTFSRSGVSVSSRGEQLRMRLVRFGYSSALRPVFSAAPRVSANRVAYARGRGLEEWYANGPLGLEQGFDVNSRPAAGRGPLTLSMTVSTPSRRRLEHGRVAIGSLRYGGLSVTDFHGHPVPARLRLRGRRLEIRVDDRLAAYPLRIDPFVQQAEFTASDGSAGDAFGASIAATGDTLVAIAPFRKAAGTEASPGAAYVFERPASGWANATESAVLTLSKRQGAPAAVAIEGDTIAVGAFSHDAGTNKAQGAAYVFVKPAKGWQDAQATAELTAADGTAGDALGSSVGISGDTIVAGAPAAPLRGGASGGAAYVFVKPGGGWKDETQTGKLTGSDSAASDQFGRAVAVSGDRILVGAQGHASGGMMQQGAAYVYAKPAGGWTDSQESAQLTVADVGGGAALGSSVAIAGPTAVVGAPMRRSQVGAAYVFVEPAGGWPSTPDASPTAELSASDGAAGDLFGFAVAISGDRIAVGAPQPPGVDVMKAGALYVFTKPAGEWRSTTQDEKLTAADGAATDALGGAVASRGSVVFGAAPLRAEGGRMFQGAVYGFAVKPAIAIDSPTDGATFSQGQVVTAAYSCRVEAGGPGAACAGDVADGAPIDTDALGPHTFSVAASDADGAAATGSVTYEVTPVITPPPARLRISGLRESRVKWRLHGKRGVGTRFTFRLNQPARVALRFTRARHGAGKLLVKGRPGTNRVAFKGRLSRTRKLRPGRYLVRLTATNARGQRSSSRALEFTILRR
jgi:hypothetical protein